MSRILETITDFFKTDAHLPHHFFTLESTTLTPQILREHISPEHVSYIFDRHYDSFGIADARILIDLQNEKTEKKSIYIIAFTAITVEAQNALLKALEEPRKNKIFFFIVANVKKLLPALQSRTYVLYDQTEKIAVSGKIDIDIFITASLEERFAIIKKITDKKLKDEEKFSKTDLFDTLNNLEIYFYTHRENSMLRKIAAARKYMNAKGASRKMILEDIAMTLSLLK